MLERDGRTFTNEAAYAERRQCVKDILQSPNWLTLESIGLSASNVELKTVPEDLIEPPEATGIRELTWSAKLVERQEILKEVNPDNAYIIHEDERHLLALYERNPDGGEKCRMWAGTTITLAQSGPTWEEGKLTLPVYPMDYSKWIACYNPRYGQAFKKEGLPLPYAGLGISVLGVTRDGFIPLTRRGIETPVYPGRLYSPGGGPKPGQTSTEAILEEILEETGLEPHRSGIAGQFNPSNLYMMALVSDSYFAGTGHQRPELVAVLPLDISFSELLRIQEEDRIRKGKKQEDVWSIVPASIYSPNLKQTIIYDGLQMCPPTEAALTHFLFEQYKSREGFNKAMLKMGEFMRKISSFDRSIYAPPIKRLGF